MRFSSPALATMAILACMCLVVVQASNKDLEDLKNWKRYAEYKARKRANKLAEAEKNEAEQKTEKTEKKQAQTKKAEIKQARKEYRNAMQETKEALEGYNEWKLQAIALLQTHKGAMLHITRLLKPIVRYINIYAREDVCTLQEYKAVDRRMMKTFNAVLGSRDFDDLEWVADKHLLGGYQGYRSRNLRGGYENAGQEEEDERELDGNNGRNCANCQGYCCSNYCPCHATNTCRRRRKSRHLESSTGDNNDNEGKGDGQDDYQEEKGDGEEDEIDPTTKQVVRAIQELDFDELEAVVSDIQRALEDQCQRLLLLISLTSNFRKPCKWALKAATCQAILNAGDVAEISLKQDGTYEAEVMP